MQPTEWNVPTSPPATPAEYALRDFNSFEALATLHRGNARPPYLNEGLWINDSAGVTAWRLYYYNGTADLLVGTINNTAGTFRSADSILNNFASTTVPTTAADSSAGYAIGSRWINTTTKRSYLAVDVSPGAAVWVEDYQSGITALSSLVSFIASNQLRWVRVNAAGTGYEYRTSAQASGELGGHIVNGRLTLTSGDPAGSTIVTGGNTIYFAPYKGNRITLWNGTQWETIRFTQKSIALTGLVSSIAYDVFGYLNAGDLALEFSAAWANNTTIPTRGLQDGVIVKNGDPTRLYLGSFVLGGLGITDSNDVNRYLQNYYNRIQLRAALAPATSGYAAAAWRAYGGNTSNRLAFFQGTTDDFIQVQAAGFATNNAVGTATGIGLAIDNFTSPVLRQIVPSAAAGDGTSIGFSLETSLGGGLHFVGLTEATGTTAFTLTSTIQMYGRYWG